MFDESWRRWRHLSGYERAYTVLNAAEDIRQLWLYQLTKAHPEAPHHEVVALWNDRMYRGKVPDAVLDKAMAEIRRRGELGLPPFDR